MVISRLIGLTFAVTGAIMFCTERYFRIDIAKARSMVKKNVESSQNGIHTTSELLIPVPCQADPATAIMMPERRELAEDKRMNEQR
jgi:hypothetical protein